MVQTFRFIFFPHTPHFTICIPLTLQILWGRLLMPHEKNAWDLFIMVGGQWGMVLCREASSAGEKGGPAVRRC